jgi:hypothetical protein
MPSGAQTCARGISGEREDAAPAQAPAATPRQPQRGRCEAVLSPPRGRRFPIDWSVKPVGLPKLMHFAWKSRHCAKTRRCRVVISSPLGGLQSYPAFEKATRPHKPMTPPRRTCRVHPVIRWPREDRRPSQPCPRLRAEGRRRCPWSRRSPRRAVHLNERGLPADEERWRAYLTDDEPRELAFFCPEYAEREFGGD